MSLADLPDDMLQLIVQSIDFAEVWRGISATCTKLRDRLLNETYIEVNARSYNYACSLISGKHGDKFWKISFLANVCAGLSSKRIRKHLRHEIEELYDKYRQDIAMRSNSSTSLDISDSAYENDMIQLLKYHGIPSKLPPSTDAPQIRCSSPVRPIYILLNDQDAQWNIAYEKIIRREISLCYCVEHPNRLLKIDVEESRIMRPGYKWSTQRSFDVFATRKEAAEYIIGKFWENNGITADLSNSKY
jgi:hypothetical protein